MTTNEEVLIAANQVANQGKKPTVALIKAKLKKKIPLPEIISVLKTWQHDPDFINLPGEKGSIPNQETPHTPANNGDFEQVLHQELVNMKKEILELKILVQELVNQQKIG